MYYPQDSGRSAIKKGFLGVSTTLLNVIERGGHLRPIDSGEPRRLHGDGIPFEDLSLVNQHSLELRSSRHSLFATRTPAARFRTHVSPSPLSLVWLPEAEALVAPPPSSGRPARPRSHFQKRRFVKEAKFDDRGYWSSAAHSITGRRAVGGL